MDQVAMAHLPGRVYEAFMSNKTLTREFLNWVVSRRECTNYTYDLQTASIAYLTSFVAVTAGIERSVAEKYIQEIEEDRALRSHLQEHIRTHLSSVADTEIFYGRRLGWYALVRARKPKTVVETGIDKGMGSCVLAAALLRNAAEGSPGRYYGIDINPRAGICFGGEYDKVGEILFGDSAQILGRISFEIDFLIADSCHAEGYEGKEYGAVQDKLHANALIISDADYAELANFALKTGRQFLFWPEWSKDHFARGAGIAIAYR
jgi:predicted O-methyltransferase YrrM